jgi:hypothetical protein
LCYSFARHFPGIEKRKEIIPYSDQLFAGIWEDHSHEHKSVRRQDRSGKKKEEDEAEKKTRK